MTPCGEFEAAWQRRFDERLDVDPPSADPAWSGHLALCPTCREHDRRFQLLDRALHVHLVEPAPERSLAERVLAGSVVAPSTLPRRMLVAAALLVVGLTWAAVHRRPIEPRAGDPPAPPRSLAESVADASTASVNLVRAASGPAGRLGQELLGSVLTDALPPAAPAVEPDRLIRDVGHRIDSGVRPLARTARRAFDFLLPASPRAGRDHRGA